MLWLSLLTLLMPGGTPVTALPLRTLDLPTPTSAGPSEAEQEFAEVFYQFMGEDRTSVRKDEKQPVSVRRQLYSPTTWTCVELCSGMVVVC